MSTHLEMNRLHNQIEHLNSVIRKLECTLDPVRPSQACDIPGMLSFEESLSITWALDDRSQAS